jgi:dolichol kinase
LGIIGFWVIVLTIGLTFITTFAPRLEVDTRRKVFHGMVIPMFLIPGLFDPPFAHLSLSLAVAIFLLCDLIRAGQLPPASQYIARFLQPYVDGRDLKGPMVVSHVFLLMGTGIGWWLTLARRQQDDWDWDGHQELAFSSGVACVGLGDAAASLIGRRFGKHKWGWKGGKSIEGSLAFTVAVVTGLSVARLWIVGSGGDWGLVLWGKLIFTGAWGSMLEAVTTGVNDNVAVPIGVWAVVSSFGL